MKRLIWLIPLAIAAFGLVRWNTLRTGDRPSAPRQTHTGLQVEVGDRVSRPDGKPWPTTAKRIILIVTSSSCPICSTNRSVEEELWLRSSERNLPVFYVVPERADHNAFAQRLAASGKAVLRAQLLALGIPRIPTLAAIDESGRVWTGSLASHRRERTLEELLAGASKPLYERISRSQMGSYATKNQAYQILGLRRPTSLPFRDAKYVVIPPDELGIRARYELRGDALTFVDCDTASPFRCQEALLTLSLSNFTHLVAVNLPRYRPVEAK